jgi:endonuclease-3 related protein
MLLVYSIQNTIYACQTKSQCKFNFHYFDNKESKLSSSTILDRIYTILKNTWSAKDWWPSKAGPFETCLGAILTQSTAWSNAELALSNMKLKELISIKKVQEIHVQDLATIIQSSGYFNSKAKKIKYFANYVHQNYDGILLDFLKQPISKLRIELLGIYGIGNETADSIILFAANKPSFVMDSYTIRIFSRIGLLSENSDYPLAQKFFHENLPHKALLFQEYHALIVMLAQKNCHKSSPNCLECPIRKECATGSQNPIY